MNNNHRTHLFIPGTFKAYCGSAMTTYAKPVRGTSNLAEFLKTDCEGAAFQACRRCVRRVKL